MSPVLQQRQRESECDAAGYVAGEDGTQLLGAEGFHENHSRTFPWRWRYSRAWPIEARPVSDVRLLTRMSGSSHRHLWLLHLWVIRDDTALRLRFGIMAKISLGTKKQLGQPSFPHSVLASANDVRIPWISGSQCACSVEFATRCAQFNIVASVVTATRPGQHGVVLCFILPHGWAVLSRITSFALPCLIIFRVCLYPNVYFPLFITSCSLELIDSSNFFVFFAATIFLP